MNPDPLPPTTDIPYTPIDRVLHALAQCERTQGELLNFSGLESHSALEKLLAPLLEQEQITVHFGEGFRVYRLAEVKPNTPWWQRPPVPG